MNAKNKIDKKLRGILTNLLPQLPKDFDEKIQLDTEGLDSMAIMQLILQIEDVFELKMPMDEMRGENFATPAQLVQLVQKLQKNI